MAREWDVFIMFIVDYKNAIWSVSHFWSSYVFIDLMGRTLQLFFSNAWWRLVWWTGSNFPGTNYLAFAEPSPHIYRDSSMMHKTSGTARVWHRAVQKWLWQTLEILIRAPTVQQRHSPKQSDSESAASQTRTYREVHTASGSIGLCPHVDKQIIQIMIIHHHRRHRRRCRCSRHRRRHRHPHIHHSPFIIHQQSSVVHRSSVHHNHTCRRLCNHQQP